MIVREIQTRTSTNASSQKYNWVEKWYNARFAMKRTSNRKTGRAQQLFTNDAFIYLKQELILQHALR